MKYSRLQELRDKIESNISSKEERDEFINMLYADEAITEEQYADYNDDAHSEVILRMSLSISTIILFGQQMSNMLSNKLYSLVGHEKSKEYINEDWFESECSKADPEKFDAGSYFIPLNRIE